MNLRYILAVLVLLMVVPGQASAYYGVSLDILYDVSQVCPCDIISADDIQLQVTNYGTKTDTVMLSMELPDGWSGFIMPEVTLASGESSLVDSAWLTPPCSTEPGTYTVKFRAESAMSGKVSEKDVTLDIMRCHDVGFSGEDYAATCHAQPKTLSVDITNRGKVRETFRISSYPEWTIATPGEVTLEPWETRTISLTATPPADMLGRQEITLAAESDSSYAAAEKKLTLDIEQCYLFLAKLAPQEDTVCFGNSADYYLTIDNLGTKADTYRIVTPAWVSSEKSTLTIPSKGRAVVKLTATPVERGSRDIYVYVTSVNNPTSIITATSSLSAVDCTAVAVSMSPAERTVCRGESTDFTVRVENTGTVVTSYTLDSTMGRLDREKLVLSPGESQNVVLSVKSGKEGMYPVTVDATAGDVSDRDSATLVVRKCHDAVMDVKPEAGTYCTGDRQAFEVYVKNTGDFEDSYVLDYGSGTREFYLQPGDSIKLNIEMSVDYPWGTENRMVFELSSRKGVHLERTVTLNVSEKDVCHAARLFTADGAAEKRIDTVVGYGLPVELVLRNMGTRPDTYNLSVNGPEWVHLSTRSVDLSPLEEERFYLYISPPFGAEYKDYEVTVLADSGSSLAGVRIDTSVLEEIPENETEQSMGLFSGGFSGMFSAAAYNTEVVLVGMLALFTIILVVLRFLVFR